MQGTCRLTTRVGTAWALLLAGSAVLPSTARAQETRQAPATREVDTVLLTNEAIYHYNAARYEDCIKVLTKLLAREPDNRITLLLRALAHGQTAVSLEIASRSVREGAPQQRRAIADNYRRMSEDLDLLVSRDLTDREAILNLLDGVVNTKLAGFAAGTYEQRVSARSKLLADARAALERYLSPPADSGLTAPTGLNRVRGEFFRGVVIYRQALRPAEVEDEFDELADPARMQEAVGAMAALVDPASETYVKKLLGADAAERDLKSWTSYPHLYLGLIRTRLANDSAERGRFEEMTALYEEALVSFAEAERLDVHETDVRGEKKAVSLSRGVIPEVVASQRVDIEAAKDVKTLPVEDVLIEWRASLAFDSNVILLGEKTATPPRIGRQGDFRATTGIAIGYTLDLGKIDGSLEKWSIGLQGRASGNWNADIDSFNEQEYGATAAVQVELWSGDEGGAGPIYAGLQYDYDYFLLGNGGFLSGNRVTPRLTVYTLDRRAATGLYFTYEIRDYLESLFDRRFDRDGEYYVVGLSQSFDAVEMTSFYEGLGWEPWGLANDPVNPDDYDSRDPHADTTGYDRWLRPYAGVEYSWDSTAGEEFDADGLRLVAGLDVPLPYGLMLNVSGDWRWQNYGGRSLVDFHRKGREDFIQRYGLGIERSFVLVPGQRSNRRTLTIDRVVMTVRADAQFTTDDSNVGDKLGQQIFEYNRAVYGLSFVFQFN